MPGHSDDAGAKKGSDRRSAVRIGATLRVRFQTLEDFVVAYTKDISRGGLFIETEELIPEGDIVPLELVLPNDGPIVRVISRVAHVTQLGTAHGIGMEFLDVGGAPLDELLVDYLAESLGDEDPVRQLAPAWVLVVDDDDAYRNLASRSLEEAGHRVTTAANGMDALAQVLRDPPDLIFSDVNMPGMDGWQLLRIVRSRQSLSHVPVIFFTSLKGEQERLKGYQLGVDDYLPKPFGEEELVARVARVLSRSRARPKGATAKNALRGDLSQVSLASLLTFVEMERRTGHLLIVSGDEIATLHIRDGHVVRVNLAAEHDGLEGVERLHHVLEWTDGRFELAAAEVSVDDDMGVATSHVLLEHARRHDEQDRGG